MGVSGGGGVSVHHVRLCLWSQGHHIDQVRSIKVVRPKYFLSQPLKLDVIEFNFHPLEVVSRYRDPQLQVGENTDNYTN